MGISGLLPLLKPIQASKHLSEFSGQTIAVDAYVWLHRGAYACAADLVTGKRTNRYVDYAMHRVRLLRHYNITPYIVFDGGPLPAKRGTESERKKKRDENLARANTLAAQGKHSQAREFYVKCVDVTPQMAYQLIKALKAEKVAYVVAPYEADAQMAYLERVGLVDGILTEDSDLLVFGCQNVLLKLDTVESTVISISRKDFASLASTSGGGISLLGWSDVEFRAMAILSGCDYLASIPGVGLKTAWSLLRKHRTVENVVSALRMEGKKNVPKGYLEAFKLAEKVFLYQRVYDPVEKALIHLSATPPEGLDDEAEAYVGEYIEPLLARKVAEGEVCPISLLRMDDINPTFTPKVLTPKSLNGASLPKQDVKGKARMSGPEKVGSTNILSFFTPKTKIDSRRNITSTSRKTSQPLATVAGRSSGKRTLAELLDQDIAAKRKKQEDRELRDVTSQRVQHKTTSRYFVRASSTAQGVHVVGLQVVSDENPVAGPSSLDRHRFNKENAPCRSDKAHEQASDESGEISLEEEEPDPVTQEDGYLSPSPSICGWDSPEVSSPLRPGSRVSRPSHGLSDDEFCTEILSSPPATTRRACHSVKKARSRTPTLSPSTGRVLVQSTPTSSKKRKRKAVRPSHAAGPDLRDMFEDWGELTSEIDECDEDSMESTQSSGGPVTPESATQAPSICVDDLSDEVICDDEEIHEQEAIARDARVANGWWERWACRSAAATTQHSKLGTLRRSETTVTTEGRHRPYSARARGGSHRKREEQDLRPGRQKGLRHVADVKRPLPAAAFFDDVYERPETLPLGSERAEAVVVGVNARLDQFRYTTG